MFVCNSKNGLKNNRKIIKYLLYFNIIQEAARKRETAHMSWIEEDS
jgi:hypothetical protein